MLRAYILALKSRPCQSSSEYRLHPWAIILAWLVLLSQQIYGGSAINQSIAQDTSQTVIEIKNQNTTSVRINAPPGTSIQVSTNTANINSEALDFEKHYLLAQHYYSRADFKLAELEIEQAIALKPNSQTAHRFYCLIALMRLHIWQAVAEFMMTVGLGHAIPLTDDQQKQLNRECALIHYRKGLSYEAQSRYARAISELKFAYYYAPQSTMILHSLAFNLGKGGLFDQAEKYYQDSFNLSQPESADDAYAHADYAYMLSAIGRLDDAIAQLSKAIAIAPGVAALHVDLSLFLEAKGNLDQAIKEMQIAINTAPKYADLTTPTKGSAAISRHPAASKIIRRPPSYASLWAHMGRLLDKENKLEQAKGAYQYALTLDPQQPEVRTRLDELDKQPPVKYPSSAVGQEIENRLKQLQKF